MQITRRNKADQITVKTLAVRLRDQAQLSDVLKGGYDLRLSILKTEVVTGE